MTNIHLEDDRRTEILDAALEVFARYGYRKTSMNEVARVAGLSRQGLYLHFRSKRILFQETALHIFERSLSETREALADDSMTLEDRLIRAFDALAGQFVEVLHGTPHRVELAEISEKLVGTLASEYRERLIDEIAKTLKKAGGAAAYKALSLDVRDVAGTLVATSRGLNVSNPTRSAYLDGMRSAVRLVCAPLNSASR